MDMSQAATFLGASILISIGIILLAILLIILNNLFSAFWKPVKIMRFHDPYHTTYSTEPILERVQPTLEPFIDDNTDTKPTLKKKV